MNIKPRLYIPEGGFDEYDLEACSIKAPEFLIGQRVEYEDGDRIKTGVITEVHLRKVNYPHWWYKINDSNRYFMECDINSGDSDNGPCGDGVSSYQELMTSLCMQTNIDTAHTNNQAAITEYDRLCELIKDRSDDVSDALDKLWDNLARSSVALHQLKELHYD